MSDRASQQVPVTYMHFRLPTQDDLHFILRAWLTAFQNMGWGQMCRPGLYFIEQQRLIGDIAARKNCRLICAVNSENTSQIYGFACGEPAVPPDVPLIMHWVYVKQPFRRLGVAREMMKQFGWEKDDPICATHWSKHLWDNNRRFMKRHKIFCNPYVLMRSARTSEAL